MIYPTFVAYNKVTDEVLLIEQLPSGYFLVNLDGVGWRVVAPSYLEHLECLDVWDLNYGTDGWTLEA